VAVKAALTVWNQRISPVFDVSRQAVVLTIEDGTVTRRRRHGIATPSGAQKIERLGGLGVDTLICGAISAPLHQELMARGIRVFAFVAGEIEEVTEALVKGALPTPALSMPGCAGRWDRSRGERKE
jgi:predicted Fe-Mo cluster-binding NifX family protein